ncbi:MipA/OmpV family protein [Acuticoccus sediminis]|uniref:MipA/OmpV family protein n=1 Tax=Acuticoccus sediminis TaxID=2184697 RepID=A0A8B2NPL8_9HYPH|nr:MipA/OmpV family protein [Acuticoccus sediminis]RAI00612.1 MipA/OmpV family protein [Acuticoccus sediminis]
MALVAVPATALVSGPSMAADPLPESVPVPESVSYRDIVIDIGAGVGYEPVFPSSKRYGPTGWPLIALQYLRLPVFGEVVTEDKKAVSFAVFPSFNFVGERKSSDAHYLDGIDDTDLSFEFGGGASFRYGFLRAFADVRYGITGHNGFVGEAGIDVLMNPIDRLTLAVGPRISAADAQYMDYYFSVPNSAEELEPYNASGGFKDVSLAATATYELTEKWRLHGRVKYTHFIGDALDSPIVEAGNDQEISVGIGLTYRFSLDLGY